MIRRVWIVFSLLVVCAAAAWGLNPNRTLSQYAHRIWNQEEGLPETTIHSLLQTRDGYLWLGTPNGLLRFDGERFMNLFNTPLHQAPPSMVTSLYEDKAGTLWVASLGNGLARIAGRQLTWFTTKDGLPSNDVTCVERHGDELWVCTLKGLVEFRDGVKRVYTARDGFPGERVHSACDATDGTNWVGSAEFGLGRLRNGRFVPYEGGGYKRGAPVHALLCSENGDVWAGTTAGLYQISKDGTKDYGTDDGLPNESIRAVTEDRNGTVWVGTLSGIARIRGGEVSSYRARNELSHRYVLSLLTDREGSLWVGTRNGLDQFSDSPVLPFRMDEGLPTDDTGAGLEDRDGTLWMGTKGLGLWRATERKVSSLENVRGVVGQRVLSLAMAPDGDIWVGTEMALHRMRGGRVVGMYGRGEEVRALLVDGGTGLWVGTNKGLRRWEEGRLAAAGEARVRSAAIVALGAAGERRLLVSTESGAVFGLSAGGWEEIRTAEPRRVVTSFHGAGDGSLWMTTSGMGLLRWKNGEVTRVRTWDGLFDSILYEMAPDSHGNFWFASSKGIFRVAQAELEGFTEGKRAGVTSIAYTTGQARFECQAEVHPAIWKGRDGNLWFSTTRGLAVVNPGRLKSMSVPPRVRIELLLVNGDLRWPDEDMSFAPRENNVTIRYAGLSFVTAERLTFRYKLEGYDRDWVNAGGRRDAYYTNLPAGSFRFRVQAKTADGMSPPAEGVVNFTIERRVYQRWWFFPALILVLAASVWAGYRMRVRQIQRQFDLVLAERSRIARELHDTLLQGFSGITMQLQALFMRLPGSPEKKQLGEIIEDSAECLAEARRSLFALRMPREQKTGFAGELVRHAREAVADRQTALVLEVDEGPFPISGEAEHQLLRIAREAITNALRHGKPKTLRVRLRRQDDVVEMAIEDDGAGFVSEQAEFGHYGLIGMRERAGEIGAKLTVNSEPGRGTDVRVRYATSAPRVAVGHDSE